MDEDWINSGISIAWLASEIGGEVIPGFDATWDRMQTEPAWREWMTTYREEIRGPFTYLAVDDRDRRLVRRMRNGDLSVHVPASEFQSVDLHVVCRRVIRDVLAIRAEMAEVPPPPP